MINNCNNDDICCIKSIALNLSKFIMFNVVYKYFTLYTRVFKILHINNIYLRDFLKMRFEACRKLYYVMRVCVINKFICRFLKYDMDNFRYNDVNLQKNLFSCFM